jgi:hypothetical protein
MKCEVCLKLLEEYIDGELMETEAAPVRVHLITCAGCATEFEALTAEQELYSRYDRALDIAPSMWSTIAAHTVAETRGTESVPRFRLRDLFLVPSFGWSFAAAMAVLIFAVLLGVVYLQSKKQPGSDQTTAKVKESKPIDGPRDVIDKTAPATNPSPHNPPVRKTEGALATVVKPAATPNRPQPEKAGAAGQSDVLFSDVAYSALEERDTQQHIEQAQNLLRSVRNIQISDDDEIDVSFEKALSRRLLNENIVLRRDAEMSGKFPAKILLSDLEPFLIDIANLPDKPAAEDLRVLKERVSKTEIVAALQGY